MQLCASDYQSIVKMFYLFSLIFSSLPWKKNTMPSPVRHYIKYAPASSKSKTKDEVRTCSAFLLNDFSRKQLSEGVMNCAIIIALNIWTFLFTFSTHFRC